MTFVIFYASSKSQTLPTLTWKDLHKAMKASGSAHHGNSDEPHEGSSL